MPTETAAPVRVWTVEAIAATLSKSALRGLRTAWDGKTPRATDCDALEKANVDVLGLPEREATALKGALRPHRGPQYDPQPGDKSTHTATGTVATVTVRKREDITVTYTNEELQTPPTTLSGSVDAWSRGGPEWVFSRPAENTAQHNPQPGDVLVEPLLVCLTREHTVLSRSGRGVRIRTVDPLSGTSEETVDLLSWRREIPRGRVWSRPCP